MAASSLTPMAPESVHADDGRRNRVTSLYQILHPSIIRIIRETISHSVTKEDIEDIASQVWLEVYQKLEDHDPDRGTISTWINAIARHRAIDYMRRVKKIANVIGFDDLFPMQNRDHGDEAPSTEYIIDKDARNPEDVLLDDERWKFISIMVKMQHMPRLMAWLYYLEAKEENRPITYQQIAERLSETEGKQISAKSVERSFARLRDRFKTLYEEEQDERLK